MIADEITNKWQKMLSVVDGYPENFRHQFKQLFILRLISENLLVFLLQILGLTLTTLSTQPFPIWFATGTGCAFIFLRGNSIIPGIFAGTFLAFYLAKSSISVAFTCAILQTIQAFLLRWISCRYISPTIIFYERNLLIKFLILAIILTSAISFLMLYCCNASLVFLVPPLKRWLHWWFANLNGILIVAMAIVSWDAFFPQLNEIKKITLRLQIYLSLLFISTLFFLFAYQLLIIIAAAVVLLCLIFSVNVRATFMCSKICIPHLKKSSNPHILNLSPPLSMKPKWFKKHVAYTMSKYGMSMCTLGMAEEFKKDGIGVNSLWPKTLIATAAIAVNFSKLIYHASRKPSIVADAAYEIIISDSRHVTGNFFIDEQILKMRGVTDFKQYAMHRYIPVYPDIFVDD